MLSERQLEALLKVFNDRMQGVTDEYLRRMGAHLAQIGSLTPSDVHRLTELKRMDANGEAIRRAIAQAASISMEDLERVLRAVAESDAAFARQWYGADWRPEVKGAPKLSAPLERILKAQLRVTAQEMKNLSQTTVLSEAYRGAVDKAVQAVQTGMTDYQSAIRSALREAGAEGLRVQYKSGLTRRLDSAVRQNVLDGVRSLNSDVQRQLGNELGADGVEISAHALCAADHLPYQGRQFSNEAFERLQSELDRPIGMWNCKHTIFPILLGISEPAYTDEELERFRTNSTEVIEIDGVSRTRYEWTQEQRRIETAVRAQKSIANLAKAAGDDVLRREAQASINALDRRYGVISERAGLYEQRERMAVSGFRRVKTAEELGDAKRFEKAEFISEKAYQRHIDKHLAEYGKITADEYINRARRLLQSKASNDILTLPRSDGSISKYRISTNEFVVGTKEGNIRTAFKPKGGIEYWRDELERN